MLLAEYGLYNMISDSTYLVLGLLALWGLYCIVMVWNRVNQKRFKNEEVQDAFLDDVEEMVAAGDFEGAAEYCDVMSDLEYRLSWVGTMIKTAPMVGLFGTVFGMMGAFKTLATAESVEPSALAGDIQVALITTASGLAIAIPLMLLVANINIKIAKMEDLVGAGLTRFFEAFKTGLARSPGAGGGSVSSGSRAEPAAVYRQP